MCPMALSAIARAGWRSWLVRIAHEITLEADCKSLSCCAESPDAGRPNAPWQAHAALDWSARIGSCLKKRLIDRCQSLRLLCC